MNQLEPEEFRRLVVNNPLMATHCIGKAAQIGRNIQGMMVMVEDQNFGLDVLVALSCIFIYSEVPVTSIVRTLSKGIDHCYFAEKKSNLSGEFLQTFFVFMQAMVDMRAVEIASLKNFIAIMVRLASKHSSDLVEAYSLELRLFNHFSPVF